MFSLLKSSLFPQLQLFLHCSPQFSSSPAGGGIPSESVTIASTEAKARVTFQSREYAHETPTVSSQGAEPSLAFITEVANENKWPPAMQ